MTDFLSNIFSYIPSEPLLFTRTYFWVFFLIIYAGFSLLKSRRLLRNTYLFFCSLFFYYKTSGLFVLILLFVTLSDFLIAKQIDKIKIKNSYIQKPWQSRFWLSISIIINLGLLFYFKYAYFFTDIFNQLSGLNLQVFDIFAYIGNGFSHNGRFDVDTIMLPVGISFYIFQIISYTTDVFRGVVKPINNIFDFGLYVSFFPQLVAGPIMRASEFVPQLYRPFNLSRRHFGMAIFWILNGLTKKIILSDFLAVNFIDRVFETPLLFSGFENLSALFFYSLQVYADFSGYTDIATGVAMLMGFYLPQNFNSPYKARNPQEFWRRWHMSLSRWLKTYIYIPLGGNRNITQGTIITLILITAVVLLLTCSWLISIVIFLIGTIVIFTAWLNPKRQKLIAANLNSFITMLLGGLWHGASWNFVLWGALNGAGMIINKWWRNMNRIAQIASITLLSIAIIIIHYFYKSPIINIATIWITALFIGNLISFFYSLISKNKRYNNKNYLSNIWAIAQTFVFITFTRLFFRSGSNIDPATQNEIAWQTATHMIQQIGSKWDTSIILPTILQYSSVFIFFTVGMMVHLMPDRFKRAYRITFANLPLWLIAIITITIVFVLYQFITADLQPFIYFQF